MVEEIITKGYLNKLDKELEFIPITFDSVFKGIFERNLDILKRFVSFQPKCCSNHQIYP